ncbi:MAG TPA: phosphate signaling complex protein PhoU [Verrucomicrobiae bacterium]
METHFEHELGSLKAQLLTMASHAEKAVNEAVRALVNRDHDLAEKVRHDDEILDRYEVEIDEQAITVLAKAPLASDLRLVTVAMKICQNLERVGDEASKIAKRARDLSEEVPVKLTVNLPGMAQLALGMLKASLDAFVRRDTAAARALIPQDKQVDALNKAIQAQLVEFMTRNPDTIARCLHLITAAKSLERIADHAKNIAEEVVYLYEAQDIRHTLKAPTVS